VAPPESPPAPAASAGARAAKPADRTATRDPGRPSAKPAAPPPAVAAAPTTAAAPPPPAMPVTTTRTEVETREIPFETRMVGDPALPRGAKRVETPGVPGVETLRYLVTVTDGQPTDRQLIDATVTKQPQHRIVAFGTRRERDPRCAQGLRVCVPLGRKQMCPELGREENAGLGGSIVVLDEDAAVLAQIEQLTCRGAIS
jgi:hypothetical protein